MDIPQSFGLSRYILPTPTPVNHYLRISPRLFALVPAAVAINLVMGAIVKELSLPVYLDTVGTVLVAVLVGFGGGALVGTISQLLIGLLTGYQSLPFVVIQWLLALLVAAATRRGGFASVWRTVAWGVACGLCCGAASAVIAYLLFRGATGGGVVWVTAALRVVGLPLPVAVAIGSGTTDVLDKGIVIVAVGTLLRALPKRILGRFPLAARAAAQ
jgi:energy-coupling factor transport system substrate-specific component